MQQNKQLPDIANTRTHSATNSLRWVGMEAIAVPLTLASENGGQQQVTAKANIYVSLDDPSAKGIHMSRLHRRLNQLENNLCDKAQLDALLHEIVFSQGEISKSAKIELSFDFCLAKSSLLSDESGFQSYEVSISGEHHNGKNSYKLALTVPYSSTCPCSAALSRQLLAEAIDTQFVDGQINKQDLLSWVQATSVATPHSQRSYAYLNLSLRDDQWPSLKSLISQTEATLATPVQTMVKRRDEQDFARLNAENLMFCEDAARKLKAMLEYCDWVQDYWFKVEHQESLHAHNAVVIDTKFNR
ncbi:GTP cyclohydrolase FolE2 [Gilvimarinus sp. 1_MG-2023]|uniref:GTP cyclohydrolase FolE2 n=1 Tax=Gilvimarinus sp. 1_MG-2023 TaxID=3062638 RepID=UPI0026E11EA8|nr:GTP cyclohydrolase FolE2 [Gilvimarinus sp. 1_MG-2023]MDO6748168.1 GTP cyclohydrolase FolE2 [Gilvimarinus sp. 1_MG-2023]